MKGHSIFLFLLLLPLITGIQVWGANRYAVVKEQIQGYTTYRLEDRALHMDFGLVPGIGNLAYQFRVNGKDVLIPIQSFSTYIHARVFSGGIPFLEPFANRLDGDSYFFEGRHYFLNPSFGNFLRDQFGQPIHGLLVYEARWRVINSGASDADGAFVTSQLDFYKYPELMAQFPFAHTIEMTYRLQDGKLENITVLRNLGASDMPVNFGYHPYFHPDGPRHDWLLSLPAREHWLLNNKLIPTGEIQPTDQYLKNPEHFVLRETALDDVFSGLDRSAEGSARLAVRGKNEQIEVIYGEYYNFAVVYAPRPQDLVCLEAYTGPTDAFNLNHKGKFPGLVVLRPGGIFRARFWIAPKGF